MNKQIFRPEITTGKWVYKPSHKNNNLPYVRLGGENYGFYLRGDRSNTDALTISSVPDLLEIYKKTREVIDEFYKPQGGQYRHDFRDRMEELLILTDFLESKYCNNNKVIYEAPLE